MLKDKQEKKRRRRMIMNQGYLPSSEVSSSSDTDEPEELERIGNINWCNSGRCFAMETNTASLCYRDTNEVPDVLF